MNRLRQRYDRSIQVLILVTLLAALSGGALAESRFPGVPDNAHAKGYGNGWKCDAGYRKVKNACAAIKMPANAYATNRSYGRGWECVRGYRESRDYRKGTESCSAIQVPSNGYLNSSGNGCACDRGYRKTSGACDAVKVPAQAF